MRPSMSVPTHSVTHTQRDTHRHRHTPSAIIAHFNVFLFYHQS